MTVQTMQKGKSCCSRSIIVIIVADSSGYAATRGNGSRVRKRWDKMKRSVKPKDNSVDYLEESAEHQPKLYDQPAEHPRVFLIDQGSGLIGKNE